MTDFSRYKRQLLLPGFGHAAQQQLKQNRVLVAGAGGLGVPVLQYLTGAGVGSIGIVDGDTINLDNLHRQVLYAEGDVGKLKAVVAKEKLSLLNATIHIEAYTAMLDTGNALDIISNYDVIIDATDNFAARYLINDACVILHKPFVYGAVQQFEGHVSVFNFNGGPTYRCLYATPPAADEIPDCNTAGVLGAVPGIIGCWQALEAIKIITGIGKTLSGYVRIFDFLNNGDYKIKLKAQPANQHITSLRESYEVACAANAQHLQPEDLHTWYKEGKAFLLIDVREPAEYAGGHLQDARSYPLNELPAHLDNVPGHIPVITYCQRGGRSSKAASWIRDNTKEVDVYEVAGGMDAWTSKLGNTLITQ